MNCRPDGWSLVLAGFWNRAIFLPEWALPRLFPLHETPGHEVRTEVTLLQALPLIYSDAQVAMEISGGRLAFRPQVLNDECLLRCERMARDMLKGLPETPVHAISVNFGFRETLPPGHVVAMFNDIDDFQLRQQGWAIGERRIVRKLTNGGTALILGISLDGGSVDFDFNFHTNVANGGNALANAIALQAVEEGLILQLRETASMLLRDIYHLDLEDEDDGAG